MMVVPSSLAEAHPLPAIVSDYGVFRAQLVGVFAQVAAARGEFVGNVLGHVRSGLGTPTVIGQTTLVLGTSPVRLILLPSSLANRLA
jgi:hypothetical protein